MKDHISSSSSQHSTPSNFHRLYVVTGKGGVGKTSLALALTKHLVSMGKKAIYHSFDQGPNPHIISKLGIPHFELELDDSTEEYVAKKLGSKMVGKVVVKTPFFHSLLNMLPGLGHMVLLGHVLNKLETDEELIIVMDSPSSGHAMTMFESPQNFKEIFKSGLLVKDIDRMYDFLSQKDILKTIIVTLPSLMAVTEGMELKEGIRKFESAPTEIVLNDALKLNEAISNASESEIPDFLYKKLSLEEMVLKDYSEQISTALPHIASNDQVEITEKLAPLMEALL